MNIETKALPLQYSQTHNAKYMRELRKQHPELLEIQYQKNKQIRIKLLDLLGKRKCVRCGYDKDVGALHIGHKRGGAYIQRRSGGTLKMYLFYLRNPDVAKYDLEILCANCNAIQQSEDREFSWLKNSNAIKTDNSEEM